MTAEPISASHVNQLSLIGKPKVPQGYYRSKLFTAPVSSNPFVAAAGPLLSLLERLCVSQDLPPVTQIRNNIEHELHAFYSRIQTQTHNDEIQAMAYYLLCATIDELIGKNYLRTSKKPAQFNAFTPASAHGNEPQECFFELLDFIKARPNQYLDLIELAYYCLIAGFEGKHHGQVNARQALDNLLEELFQLIQQYRAEKTYHLFKQAPSMQKHDKKYKPMALIAFACLSFLCAGYLLSLSMLEHKATNMQLSHHFIDNGPAHG